MYRLILIGNSFDIAPKIKIFTGIEKFIEYFGAGNLLSVTLFLLSIFYAFYLYFKSFYRLVFSHARICKNCSSSIKDWTSDKTKFISRLIILNNGRKTVSSNEVSFLTITSNKIQDYLELTNPNKTTIKEQTESKIDLTFDYLDSSKYIILEIHHQGLLKVEGRIMETGEILDTETFAWKVVNILFISMLFIVLFYNCFSNYNSESLMVRSIGFTIGIFFVIFFILRFINSLLFIPDTITKYLNTTDKFDTEFKIKM